MENISKHCTYSEATKSQTAVRLGIKNTPNPIQLQAMKDVASNIFEVVRVWLNKPITISSFFRSSNLNSNVKNSSKTSQHSKGEAMDLDTEEDNIKIFKYIKDNLDFDQLIWEYGDKKYPAWVHVSYTTKRKNRKDIKRCYLDPKTKEPIYIPFDLKLS